jgi:hypothetical protein
MASLLMIQEDKRAEFIAIEGGGNRMGVWSELNSDYTAQLRTAIVFVYPDKVSAPSVSCVRLNLPPLSLPPLSLPPLSLPLLSQFVNQLFTPLQTLTCLVENSSDMDVGTPTGVAGTLQ